MVKKMTLIGISNDMYTMQASTNYEDKVEAWKILKT